MDLDPTAFLMTPFLCVTALLTKLAAFDLAVQQAHGDVPASGSVYCGVAGLLAFQIVPGDVTVRCLHHCHSIIPYRKDAPKQLLISLGPP